MTSSTTGSRPMLAAGSNALSQLTAAGLHRPGGPLRLHLGCGEQHFDGYINIDHPPSEHSCQTRIGADAFADITRLEFPAGTVDEFRLHHVFEHFKRAEALALLIQWHEALKMGGRLHLETPDIAGCARQLASDLPLRLKQAVLRHCFGSQEAGWANHCDGWSGEKFHHVLRQFGFSVETADSSWAHPPYLANVEARATKTRTLSRAELLSAADRVLGESMVADVPSERGMWEVWKKNLRDFLPAETPAPVARVSVVVFSKDRALQLEATLRSFLACCTDTTAASLNVLHAASDTFQADQYAALAREFPQVRFVRERDFRLDLLDLVRGSDHVLFLVDDNVFVREFRLGEALAALKDHPDAIGFSLRLGRNISHCYTVDRPQQAPAFGPVGPRTMKFSWPAAELDFGYPLEVSSSIYRTREVWPILSEGGFGHPNGLEALLARHAAGLRASRPSLLCFEQSVTFCNAVNKVQTVAPDNRAGARPEYSIPNLARRFATGERIDLAAFTGFVPRGCHQEVELSFQQTTRIAGGPPAVSVIIGCHNYASCLPEAVASVLNQTWRDFEILIVDDGSTDDSLAVARRLAGENRSDRPIRVFHLENVGPSATRRFAIEQSRGRYFLPLDADDMIGPEFLERTVPILEANPHLGFAYVDIVNFGDSEVRTRQPEYDFGRLCRENIIGYCSLVRREAFDSVDGYDRTNWGYYEDWDLWIRLGEAGWYGRHLAEPHFYYRHHFGTSLSLYALRLDFIYRAYLVSRHPRVFSSEVVADAMKSLEELPPGWHAQPPLKEIEPIEAMLSRHPGHRHLQFFLALAQFRRGLTREAEATLQQLLAGHPDDSHALRALHHFREQAAPRPEPGIHAATISPAATAIDTSALFDLSRPTGFLARMEEAELLNTTTDQCHLRTATINGETDSALYLHPPGRVRFQVPTGQAGRFACALAIHPDAWDKPRAGGCEFLLEVDGRRILSKRIDPTAVSADRRWHPVELDIPANTQDQHVFTFSTRAVGTPPDFRWALWRRPVFTCQSTSGSGAALGAGPVQTRIV